MSQNWTLTPQQVALLLDGVNEASREVLTIYERDFAVEYKDDSSPLTEADLAAHHALVALLKQITPEVPVLSEEASDIPFATRRTWQRLWIIDPLDGTKEFVKKNGEFTLNVALVEDGEPVFGIVHAPVLETTWWGMKGQGAFKRSAEGERRIQVRKLPQPDTQPWYVVGSRSHSSGMFETFCSKLPTYESTSMGSSIKLCLVAEGVADLYPRLAPTSEWDTAAAQAVVTAAGGEVLDINTLEPLTCNRKESVLNPYFIVCGERDPIWIDALKTAVHDEGLSGEQIAGFSPSLPYEHRANDSLAEVIWNRSSVTPAMRAQIKGHAGKCIWFTGLSGSGKSTLANALEAELNRLGCHTMLLDGDNIRHGLCKDLGMSEADRNENIRRIGEVAKLFTDAGIIVITAFISPFQSERDAARALFDEGNFIEVYVDTPLGVCEKRDPKGLYKKARAGQIKNFTGINSPYERPLTPDVRISTAEALQEELISTLLKIISDGRHN